jgi:hypothetical protein
MSQLTKAFSVNKGGSSSAGGAAFGVVLMQEPEHAPESKPIGGTGEFSTLTRAVGQRVEGEPP